MVDEDIGPENTIERTGDESFVEVMFAKSLDEAAGCRTLLLERRIPARVEVDSEIAKRCGIAVLVPADRLIEASELLASRAQDEDGDFDDYEEEEDDEDLDDFDDEDQEDEEPEDDDDDFEEELEEEEDER